VPRSHAGTGDGLSQTIGGNVGDGLRPSPTKLGVLPTGALPCAPTAIHRSWQDEFGTLIATLEGRSGGLGVMVIAALEDAESALNALQTVPSFKGRMILAVLEQLHTAPLEMVIKANQPNIVIALEPSCLGITTRGAAINTQSEQVTSSTGMTYVEPGQYLAWTAGHLEPELNSNLEHPSIAASVASSLKIPCAACDLTHLPKLLETLLV
jgi:hypothetical protein